MILTLQRLRYTTSATFGELIDENGHHLCFTLERPDLDNQHNISCIPTGTYPVFRRMHAEGTPNAYRCWGLEHVPNRDEIEIHKANLAIPELQGCIAVGTEFGEVSTEHGNGYGIRHSGDALALLDEHPTGAWQLGTGYVHKVQPDSLADVQGVMAVIRDGSYEIEKIQFFPERPVWKP